MIDQAEKVLQYLKTNKTITSLKAIDELGIMQLPGRIFKLKKTHVIKKVMRKVKTRDGGVTHVAEYSLWR